MRPDIEAIRKHATDGLSREDKFEFIYRSDKYTFQLLDYISELEKQLESATRLIDQLNEIVEVAEPYHSGKAAIAKWRKEATADGQA